MPAPLRTEDGRERLVSACRTAAGDSIRSLTYFTPEGYEQLYLREDLSRDADLESFVDIERGGFDHRSAYEGTELGEYRFTIRAFEHGYVARIIEDDAGVFVTMDGGPMYRFREVASAVESILDQARGSRSGPE